MQIHPLLFLRTNWFSIANKCTLADSCHGGDLAIGLPLSQEGQCMIDLLRLELLRSAISEVRVLPCHCFSCLRSFNECTPLVIGKRKHDGQNQITCQCVFYKSHVQNMNSDTSFKQLPNNLNALNGSSGKAVELTHHKRVPFLKFFQKTQELRSVHGLASERLFHNLLAAVLLKGSNLILQTVSISALGCSRYSCVSVNHGFFLRFYDTKF